MSPNHRHRALTIGLVLGAALAPAAAGQTLLAWKDGSSLPGSLSQMVSGTAVTAVGDLDADGCTDLVVGGPGLYAVSSTDCLVFSGRTLALLGPLVPPPIADLAQFGRSLDAPGDVDGDGVPDVLVGAPGGVLCAIPFGCSGSSRGAASLQSGATLLPLRSWEGAAEGDVLGFDVASVGDVDGDGVSDVALGAPQRTIDPGSETGAGYVRLYSGQSGALLGTLAGAALGDGFGWEVVGPGDVDGDGHADVLVRSPWAAGLVAGAGRVDLFRASDGAPLHAWLGESDDEDFGHIGAAGDVDGDGLPDVLIGAPRHDGPAGVEAGVARVCSGVTGDVLLVLDGHAERARLGVSLCGLGDLNGDGRGELLVGAAPPTIPPSPAPYARLFSGRAGAVIYHIDHVPAFGSPANLPLLGQVVAPAGDTNGDGLADFVLSSPNEVVVGGDVIHNHGGRHLLAWSGLPIPVTTMPNPGSPGSAGVPALSGEGSTLPNQLLTLHLQQAASAAPVLLAIGTEIHATPVSGVTLWPFPPALFPVGATDLGGALDVAGRWPAALGYGTVLFAQALVADAGAPAGVAASNTLQLTSQ
jgi:hypothetical protein